MGTGPVLWRRTQMRDMPMTAGSGWVLHSSPCSPTTRKACSTRSTTRHPIACFAFDTKMKICSRTATVSGRLGCGPNRQQDVCGELT